MTKEQYAASGGLPMAPWVFTGIFMAAFWGIAGYLARDSGSQALLVASVAALLVFGSWALWRRAEEKHPVPAAEYLAVVWVLTYVALAVIERIAEGRLNAFNWLTLLPPLSIIPFALRVLLLDDGSPRGRARTAAYYAHQVIGIWLCGVGLLLIVTIWLLLASPVVLAPGILHLRAGFLYRQKRRPRKEPDPRRGFMDAGRSRR